MMEGRKARLVCTTCKARKKACDKQLPCCGYCSQRGIGCSYEVNADFTSAKSAETPAPFLQFSTPLRAWKQYSRGKAFHVVPEQLTPPSETVHADGLHNLDTMLNLHVSRFLRDVGLSLREISDEYFRSFHKWLPIICPTLFEETLAQYIVPSADFSILALAVCLVALYPPSASHGNSPTNSPEPFYVFVKMLVAQVQAETPTSIRLIQANLLISAYEYACGRLQIAYNSMGACFGMAYSLDIDKFKDLQAAKPRAVRARLRSRESWNLWWGLVIVQRLIVIDLPDRSRWPRAQFPDADSPLPCGLVHVEKPGWQTDGLDLLTSSRLSETSVSHISCFSYQAQAVYLLDKMLEILGLSICAEDKVYMLKNLDEDTQSLMKLAMSNSVILHQSFISRSGLMATTLRTMFAIHEEILTLLAQPSMGHCKGLAEASQATISTVVAMVVDIAHHRIAEEDSAERPAPCCIYCLRSAQKHAEHRQDAMALLSDLEESLLTPRTIPLHSCGPRNMD